MAIVEMGALQTVAARSLSELKTDERRNGVQNSAYKVASIHFSWTDLSSAGASQRETRSDANGLFSLDGVRGKNLGVLVAKDGYDLSRTKNQFRFEYAGFWEKDFHESDVKRPVAFTLHKKPQAEPLVFREEEIAVAVGRRVMLNLDPQTTLEVELLANEQPRAKNWSARLSVKCGGLQVTTEEFPIEAPADGYRAELTIGHL